MMSSCKLSVTPILLIKYIKIKKMIKKMYINCLMNRH